MSDPAGRGRRAKRRQWVSWNFAETVGAGFPRDSPGHAAPPTAKLNRERKYSRVSIHPAARFRYSVRTVITHSCALKLCGFLRLRRPAIAVAAALLGLAIASAQTVTIGVVPNADQNALNVNFAAGLSSSAGYLLPFKFTTALIGGNYSLTSVSLLLTGNASLSDFSILATSTLATDLTVPASLATFATTGTLTATPTAYSFTTGASATLTADTTYYIRVLYTGTATANWVNASGAGPTGRAGYGPTLVPLDASFLPGSSLISYRQLNAASFTDQFNGTKVGFSITASAIPEPSTYAAIAGGFTLLAALAVRLKRRRTATP